MAGSLWIALQWLPFSCKVCKGNSILYKETYVLLKRVKDYDWAAKKVDNSADVEEDSKRSVEAFNAITIIWRG